LPWRSALSLEKSSKYNVSLNTTVPVDSEYSDASWTKVSHRSSGIIRL